MRRKIRWIFTLQNALSLTAFTTLAFAELSAYFLNLYPRSEWWWFLSVRSNQIAMPALDVLEGWIPRGPVGSIAILSSACLITIAAQRWRSWFGTSVAGHVALFAYALLTLGAFGRLSPVFNTEGILASTLHA